MFIPLGPAGKRRLPPFVTIAIIVVNVVIHVATLGVAEDGDARVENAARHMWKLQRDILEEQDAFAMYPIDELITNEVTGRPMPQPAGFWGRWERGDIVETSDVRWREWQDAKLQVREAVREQLHMRFGFRANKPGPVSLVTSAFLHGGWGHLIMNMLMLWAVGATLEESWGRRLFALAYLVGVLIAPWGGIFGVDGGRVPGIGASGAIATVMGAFAVRHFTERIRLFSFIPIPGVYNVHGGWFLLLWFGSQVLEHGKSLKEHFGGGVGFGVHVLGFLAGLGVALAFRAGGLQEKAEPQQEKLKAKVTRDEHAKLAEEMIARSDVKGASEQLRLAIAATPDDVDLRIRLYEVLRRTGDPSGARAEALQVMPLLWRLSDKTAFTSFFARSESELSTTWPPQWTFRCAFTHEPANPHEAGRLHARVIQASPGDPHAKQSLERYARILERLGDPERAAQARAMLPHLEQHQQRTPPPG